MQNLKSEATLEYKTVTSTLILIKLWFTCPM